MTDRNGVVPIRQLNSVVTLLGFILLICLVQCAFAHETTATEKPNRSSIVSTSYQVDDKERTKRESHEHDCCEGRSHRKRTRAEDTTESPENPEEWQRPVVPEWEDYWRGFFSTYKPKTKRPIRYERPKDDPITVIETR